jgi:CrcB protein
MSELAGWAAVGVLAATGALARLVVGDVVQRRVGWTFPVGILVVNTSGSLALGVLAGVGASGWALRLAGAALLGSYTTFSTWIFDSQQMAATRDHPRALGNLLGSLVLGLAAVALGWALGRTL